jgi:hypothetical protein
MARPQRKNTLFFCLCDLCELCVERIAIFNSKVQAFTMLRQGYGGQAEIEPEVQTQGVRVSCLNPSASIRVIRGKTKIENTFTPRSQSSRSNRACREGGLYKPAARCGLFNQKRKWPAPWLAMFQPLR